MTVHVGRLTSEVNAVGGDRNHGPVQGADAGEPTEPTEWAERRRLAAVIRRHQHDRLRTATGYGDD